MGRSPGAEWKVSDEVAMQAIDIQEYAQQLLESHGDKAIAVAATVCTKLICENLPMGI